MTLGQQVGVMRDGQLRQVDTPRHDRPPSDPVRLPSHHRHRRRRIATAARTGPGHAVPRAHAAAPVRPGGSRRGWSAPAARSRDVRDRGGRRPAGRPGRPVSAGVTGGRRAIPRCSPSTCDGPPRPASRLHLAFGADADEPVAWPAAPGPAGRPRPRVQRGPLGPARPAPRSRTSERAPWPGLPRATGACTCEGPPAPAGSSRAGAGRGGWGGTRRRPGPGPAATRTPPSRRRARR